MAVARRVAVVDRGDVAAERLADLRILDERFLEGEADDLGADDTVVEPLGDAVDDRVFQPVVIEDRRVDEARDRRLGGDDRLGLTLDLGPDRIDLAERLVLGNSG